MTYTEREALYEEWKAKFKVAGWSAWQDSDTREGNLPYYVCRKLSVTLPDCLCNDKPPSYYVKLYHLYPGLYNNWNIPHDTSAEVNLAGELPDGEWIHIKRSVKWENLIDDEFMKKLDKLFAAAYTAAHDNVDVKKVE